MVQTRTQRKAKATQAHLDELIDLVQPTKPPAKVRVRKEKPFSLDCRRQLTKQDVERIFFLRFNSHTDMSRVQRSYKKISLLLHIPIMTCHMALRRYVEKGQRFESGRAINLSPDSHKKLAHSQEQLRSRDTRLLWSGFTLTN